jgi:hypothetical protein
MKIGYMHDGRKMIILTSQAAYDEFNSIKENLFNRLGVTAHEYIDDYDDLYISFEYNKVPLILSFGNFTGVVIYSKSTIDQSKVDEALLSLANVLSSD